MKTLSLFHGVGGLTSTVEGLDLVAVSEFEENIFLTADAAHFAKTGKRLKNLGDITKIKPGELEALGNIDIIIASPPCQAYSIGGKRESREDPRGLLWGYAVEIIKQVKPKVVVVENVKNLISIEDNEVLKWYLRTLSDLGYVVDFEIINAGDLHLQQRERFFMCGIREDKYEEYRSNSEETKEDDSREGEEHQPESSSLILSEGLYYREKDFLRESVINASSLEDGGEPVSSEDKEDDGGESGEELCAGEGSKKLMAFSKSHRAGHIDVRSHVNLKVNTLTTGFGTNHQSTGNYLLKDGKFHILTPEQAETLMGWPTGMTSLRFKNVESSEVVVNSESIRYKMIGNGVCGGILDSILDNLKILKIL